MKKFFLFFLIWLLSIILASIYTYENPEKAEIIKNYFKKNKNPEVKIEKGDIQKVMANSFIVEFSKEVSFTGRTAFVVHENNITSFNINSLEIYTQNGFLNKNNETKKLNLSKNFTTLKNGGIKSIFYYKDKKFALISSLKNDCFYASIVSLNKGKELFKTKCLPNDGIDFNGLGSSHIHHEDNIYLSIGAPEQRSSAIRSLAQKKDSMFGKIVEINKKDLNNALNTERENTLKMKIYTSGHRNPQGFTKIGNSFFSVEHGPRGGDELNKIIKDKNYGWPEVSYGTQYFYDEDGKSYKTNHKKNKFQEPIFALVPSVGISSLNVCPQVLEQYYQKPCLIALSLYGNSLRPGRSLIIYLLNEELDKIHSIEKIFLRDDLKLRHFVTNSLNEIYEDELGNIFVSADKKGIYKISFVNFRN